MVEKEEKTVLESVKPVEMLAVDYAKDLEILRNLSPSPNSITSRELQIVKKLAVKYGLNDYAASLNRRNFFVVQGFLMSEIRRLFEELTISHIMEREREKSPTRRPKKPAERYEEVKRIL